MVAVRSAPQIKSVDFSEFKALDESQGIFEGYLSVFGNVDSYKDIVERGAFQKTINDARGRHATYLFPVLWQHDPKEPIGGFIEMNEDPKGLYVRGQIDLTTPRGKQAYSGIKMGYLSGLSIGYDTIKHKYVGDIRHLLEVRMWEGSIVTFPANPETQIANVKAACGSTDWPLGDRNEAWDGPAAHNEIVKWATNDDGTLDVDKMKSVHFYVSDDDPQKVGSYKLPFCRIKENSPVAIPRGIFAVAGSLGGSRGKGAQLDGDDDAVKARVNSYYTRMREKFDDSTLVAPWKSEDKEEEKDESKALPEKPETTTGENQEVKQPLMSPVALNAGSGDDDQLQDFEQDYQPRDFQTIMDQRTPDELIDELYDLFGALLTAVLENLYGVSDENTCKATIIKSMTQFQNYILDWLDDAYDAGLGADEDEEDDDNDQEDDDQNDNQGNGKEAKPPTNQKYMLYPSMTIAHFTLSTRALKHAIREYVKEGRMLSQNTHSRISTSIESIMKAATQLNELLSDATRDYTPDQENEYVPNGENEPEKPDKNEKDSEEASDKRPPEDPTEPNQAQQKKSEDEPSQDTQPEEQQAVEPADESLSEEDMLVVMQMQLQKMKRDFESKASKGGIYGQAKSGR